MRVAQVHEVEDVALSITYARVRVYKRHPLIGRRGRPWSIAPCIRQRGAESSSTGDLQVGG